MCVPGKACDQDARVEDVKAVLKPGGSVLVNVFDDRSAYGKVWQRHFPHGRMTDLPNHQQVFHAQTDAAPTIDSFQVGKAFL